MPCWSEPLPCHQLCLPKSSRQLQKLLLCQGVHALSLAGQIHGFFNLTGVTDRSEEAIKECADALAEALKVPRVSKTK